MTRFEKIKPMDIDEISDYFMSYVCAMIDDCPVGPCSCHDCIKAWFEEEVEE